MTTIPISEKQHRKALAFAQCATCTYDIATNEGSRNCNYGECPYLPEALDVTCPVCNYNFYARDTNPGCGDKPTCDFATHVVGPRLRVLREWLEAQAEARAEVQG